MEKYLNKLKRRLEIKDDEQNDLLMDELESAIDFINLTRGYTPTIEVPIEPQYLGLMVDMAYMSWLKKGAEGEITHSENGISRTYDSGSNYPTNLVNKIIPLVKSIKRANPEKK